MADRFSALSASTSSPGTRSTPINPHDSQEIDPLPLAVHVGGAGSIVGRLKDDQADRTWTVVAGQVLPYRFKLIKTASTATGLIGID